MSQNWNDDQPIYKQLKQRVIRLILNDTYDEGEAVPSVRSVASELQINHLTVGKAYQELVEESILYKKRGLGMFVSEGAKEVLLNVEKEKFLTLELPKFIERVHQLGISQGELIDRLSQGKQGEAQ